MKLYAILSLASSLAASFLVFAVYGTKYENNDTVHNIISLLLALAIVSAVFPFYIYAMKAFFNSIKDRAKRL